MVENIVHCLEEVGGQLRGLKIQCSGFDLSDIAVLCPHLKSLIIQKEAPNPGKINTNPGARAARATGTLNI